MRRVTYDRDTKQKLDAVACSFLGSDFTDQIYANLPIERRVGAYLRHHGLTGVVTDGGAFNALLERVMANIGRGTPRRPTPGAAQLICRSKPTGRCPIV
jgi:hypothetical protein